MTRKYLLLFLLGFCAFSYLLSAQVIHDPSHLLTDQSSAVEVVLELIDGAIYSGELVEMTGKCVVINLETDHRDITIPRYLIDKMVVMGTVWSLDQSMPHPDYYFASPSAIPTSKGKFVYRNQMLAVNSIRYGFNRDVSIGGGFELLSRFTGQNGGIYHLNVKASAKVTGLWHIAGGYLALIERRFRKVRLAHLPYVVNTWGSESTNVSLRVEYSFNRAPDEGILTYGIAGRVRIARRAGIYFESVLLRRRNSSSDPLLGNGGFQLFGRRSVFTAGLFILAFSEGIELLSIPAIGFTRSF